MRRICPVCGKYSIDPGESDCGCVEEARLAERKRQAARQQESLIRQQKDGQLTFDMRAVRFGNYI